MKLAIIGTGYVGLVTGTCFAEMGNEVVCVDIDEAKLTKLRDGVLPLFEPGLVVLFERGIKEDRLSFTDSLAESVPEADVVFLTLPTPPDEDGSADLSYVLSATEEIAAQLRGYTVIVSKSTVPVGTTEALTDLIWKHKPPDAAFDVVSNPEFLREGIAVDDFMKPERIIIGSSSERAISILRQLYEPFVRSGNPIIAMDARSAEMTKYAANAILATKISFMNEIANLCERLEADVDNVRLGIGSDSRIGKDFLYAGIGYGGSCFPKDVAALSEMATKSEYDFEILRAVSSVNERQRTHFAERIVAYLGNDLSGSKVAVWGLAFKPNTDDIREAPSLVVIDCLLRHGAAVSVFDPEAMGRVREKLGSRVEYARDPYAALDDARALVICTEWNEFRRPDFAKMHAKMAKPVIFDGRNIFDPLEVASSGFYYESIGRRTVSPESPEAV